MRRSREWQIIILVTEVAAGIPPAGGGTSSGATDHGPLRLRLQSLPDRDISQPRRLPGREVRLPLLC